MREVITVGFEEALVIEPHAVDTDLVTSATYWQYCQGVFQDRGFLLS
jgi:hypothetical protein